MSPLISAAGVTEATKNDQSHSKKALILISYCQYPRTVETSVSVIL